MSPRAGTSVAKRDYEPLYTIGYEGRTLADFLAALKKSKVECIVDVRELPLSRRKGFSKTALGEALSGVGIEYIHLRAAGNPFRAEKDDIERCLKLFAKHLDGHSDVLGTLEETISGRRCALLCFEANPRHCHRSIIGTYLKKRNSRLTIVNL
jgi:uncharacterized protein (DUF488 family)